MRWRFVLVCSLFAAACASGPEPPPFQPIADNKLLMNAVIEPAAEHVWESVGTITTFEGVEDLAPKTEEEWTAVRNGAVALAESGNLLMIAPRAKDEEWMRLAQALIDTSVLAVRAAEKHDAKQTFEAGAQIYDVCTACHAKYVPDFSGD